MEKMLALAMPQNVPRFFYNYAGCIWKGVGGIPSWLCLSCVTACDVCLHSFTLVLVRLSQATGLSTALLSIPCVSHKWSINMSRMCI